MTFKKFCRIMGWCGAIIATALIVSDDYAQSAAQWGHAIFWYLVGKESTP